MELVTNHTVAQPFGYVPSIPSFAQSFKLDFIWPYLIYNGEVGSYCKEVVIPNNVPPLCVKRAQWQGFLIRINLGKT